MDNELSQLLRSLPRAKASDGFTRTVMGRIRPEESPVWWRVSLVPAAIALVVAMLAGHQVLESREERLRLQMLKAEQQRLRMELDELKSMTPSEPMFYVGSNGMTDYVVDLRSGAAPQAIVPASYTVDTF